MALLTPKALKIINGRNLTVLTSHDVSGILNSKVNTWMADSKLLKYQPLLLEGHITKLKVCGNFNPATFLPEKENETPDHDCSQFLTLNYAPQEDLMATPLDNLDMEIFTDGSSFVQDGKCKACYTVVMAEQVLLFIYFFFYFTILYWFCHTSKCICHGCTRVPHPKPPSNLPPHAIPLGHPSAPAPNFLYPASNLDWRFLSYMILYMF